MEAASLSPDDDDLVKKLALMDLSAVIGYQILYDELISKVKGLPSPSAYYLKEQAAQL